MTETTAVDADEARRLRDAMTDKIVKLGSVTSPRIEAAFRAVPRHAFGRPGTPLEECYHGDVVRNKKDADGVTLSSISAAWLQARMIDQAGVGPGARVLEIGTTGYNAAVIAEVTGPGGHVVTVDIDPEVADLEDVYLFSIDDLQQLVDENIQQRELAAGGARLLDYRIETEGLRLE